VGEGRSEVRIKLIRRSRFRTAVEQNGFTQRNQRDQRKQTQFSGSSGPSA
jgi:hypothetical protein